ncbi:MAG TPA: thiamine phosphate synthase [Pirellulales bacterium]|nr:thiamine phosphate synthase [Pirellulales bacterium]
MSYTLTPAAQFAIDAAARWQLPAHPDELTAPALLLGLLAEPEYRAAAMLAARGIDTAAVRRRWPELAEVALSSNGRPVFSLEVEAALSAALNGLVDYARPLTLATEHLLLGLAASRHEVAAWLAEHGCTPETVLGEINRFYGNDTTPLELEAEPIASPLTLGESPGAQVPVSAPVTVDPRVLRILDAAANRAREGLRVVEDYVRFVLDDGSLTEQLKQLRHDLAAVLALCPTAEMLGSRDTPGDVGTTVTTASEQRRSSPEAVVAASLKRLQESLRSLEEFGKLVDSALGARFEQLRYRAYTVEQAVFAAVGTRRDDRLASARLYVLLDGRASVEAFQTLVRQLVAHGVDVIQLRDKQLADGALLGRARLLRSLTRGTSTLFVMNDRPDLAVLAGADGVHVGQDELSVAEVRRIVGSAMLVGVSTHTIEQARQAVRDGADYLGVGPVFPSTTKQFAHLAGLGFVRQVAAEIALPAFAIGGITLDNVEQVVSAGLHRVATSAAILSAHDPAAAAGDFARRLKARSH